MKNLFIIPLLGLALLCHCQTIIDINSSGLGSDAANLTVFEGKVYFSADDGVNGQGIYFMDNNSLPTRLSPGLFENPSEFTVLDDRLYFSSGPFQLRQLYCIESSNTNLIVEIDNSTGRPAELIAHDGMHYFVNQDAVYRISPNSYEAFSIGSTNGMTISSGMPNSTDMDRKYIFVASDKLFFNTANGIYFIDLLQFTGAQLVINSNNYEYEVGPPGGGDYAGYYVGDKVVYRNIGVGMDSEILLIDASSPSPSVAFIDLSNATSSRPTFFIESQGILFFTAFNDDENMNVIWYMDDSASTISDFNYILGVQSAQNNSSGASNDPFIKVSNELFHFRNRIDVVNGIPNVSQIEECFTYPYFNHQVMSYAADYYYIGCCFDLFRCNDGETEQLTCVGGIDNAIGKFVLLDDKFYLISPTSPNFAVELLRWPEDQGNGICQENCENDSEAPSCNGNNFNVQLDPGQNYYTFDINDFASDECTPILTYENASLDPSTPNGTTTHFWSGNNDQFPCGTYIITSSFPFDDAGNFNDCAFTFTVECSMDTCNNVAMHFDGVDDYIELDSPFNSDQDYTIELWVKSESNSTGACSNNTSSNLDWILAFEDNDLGIVDCADGYRVVFAPLCPSGNNLCSSLSTQPLNDGSWHHLAISEGSVGGFRVYYDGVKFTNFSNAAYDLSGKIRLGSQFGNQAGNKFKGKMDEFRIWNYIRSEEEILENYNCKIDPESAGLVTYYDFSDGDSQMDNQSVSQVTDLVGNDQNGVLNNFNLLGNFSNFIEGNDNLCNMCGDECTNDTIPPICISQNINLSLDDNGMAVITPDMIDNGSSDNCSEVILALEGNTIFDCSHIGTNEIILIVEDESNNQDSCLAMITVEDKTSPIIDCPLFAVNYELPLSGIVESSIDDYDIEVDEACSFSIEGVATLSCANLDSNISYIDVIVTDDEGNSSSCQVGLTVSDPNGYCDCLDDITPPVINCLNQIIEFPINSSGIVEVSLANLITATDDCSEVSISGGSGVFNCSHVSNVPQFYTVTATNEIGLQSTCQQGFLITDPEGFCQPYTCLDEDCPTNVIDLSTGLDNDNMLLPIGQYVGNWQLIDGPDQGLNYPRPGYVLNPNLVWDQLPGTQYISPFPNASNNQSFSDPYVFERCFCVCEPNATVQLDIAAYVDNFINIGLYDDQGNVIDADLIDYQLSSDVNTFLSPAFISNTSHQLNAGTYCLRAELRNDGSVTMGMEINAVVSGAGFIESKCCLPYSIITGTVFNDLQCDSLNNLNQDNGIENIVVYLSDASGTIIATSTTDQLGYYVFNDVPAGELYISQDPIPDYSLSLGSGGYQVVMGLNNALGDFDFGNCIVEDTCCATSEELTNEVEASINSSIVSIGDEVVISFPDLYPCQYISKIWWGDGQVDVFTLQDVVAMHNYQSNSVYHLSIEVSAVASDGTLCQTDVIDKCIIFKDCISSTEWIDPENAKFKVYPIPFQDAFNIDLSSNENGYNFSLFNISGQLVREAVVDQNIMQYAVNGANLIAGTYILRLQDVNSNTVLETRILKVE